MKIIEKTRVWFFISLVMISFSIVALAWNGFTRGSVLNFGIDFTGGTLINLRFPEPVSTSQVRDVLGGFKLEKSVIQNSAENKNDIFIRTSPVDTETRVKLVEAFKEKYSNVELLEVDTVGPVIGNELRIQALLALLLASAGIIIYVSFRFEFVYALAAIFALFHDVIIATGVMALFWRDVELPFIAAILTIMGYSINDTIIIFDRIRENLHKPGKHNFTELVNRSIAETFPRSINTVLTVITVVLCLLFFGGKTLKDFSFILLVGFSVGMYSSIYVASPLVVMWKKNKK